MISNPEKLCVVHARKNILYIMRYALAMKMRSRTEELRAGWHKILLEIGQISEKLKERIRVLPDMVDAPAEEWIIKARYIKEYEQYERSIEATTNSLIQSARKGVPRPSGQLS